MSDRINSDRSLRIDVKKMIRRREITLALISKCKRFGLKTRFFEFFVRSEVSDPSGYGPTFVLARR